MSFLGLENRALFVNAQDEAERNAEGNERRPAVADQRQGDARDRQKAEGHADVHEQLRENHGNETDDQKFGFQVCRVFHDLERRFEKKPIEKKQKQGPHITPFLSNHAKDKIGVMLRHKLQLALRSGEIPFSEKTARPNRDFRLDRGVTRPQRV